MNKLLIGAIVIMVAVIGLVSYFIFTSEGQEELLLVIEVSRHGARTPSKLFPFTKNPSDNFNNTD